jgi:hypothetical protein
MGLDKVSTMESQGVSWETTKMFRSSLGNK